MTADQMAEILAKAATLVGDTLSHAGVTDDRFAFSIILWPINQPDHCSFILGCRDEQALMEHAEVLASASQKIADGPTHRTRYKNSTQH